MSLVNETLGSETETRPRRDLRKNVRDRDEIETFQKRVSRPSRDETSETETTSLVAGDHIAAKRRCT